VGAGFASVVEPHPGALRYPNQPPAFEFSAIFLKISVLGPNNVDNFQRQGSLPFKVHLPTEAELTFRHYRRFLPNDHIHKAH
jgi:hypothetical protein